MAISPVLLQCAAETVPGGKDLAACLTLPSSYFTGNGEMLTVNYKTSF